MKPMELKELSQADSDMITKLIEAISDMGPERSFVFMLHMAGISVKYVREVEKLTVEDNIKTQLGVIEQTINLVNGSAADLEKLLADASEMTN